MQAVSRCAFSANSPHAAFLFTQLFLILGDRRRWLGPKAVHAAQEPLPAGGLLLHAHTECAEPDARSGRTVAGRVKLQQIGSCRGLCPKFQKFGEFTLTIRNKFNISCWLKFLGSWKTFLVDNRLFEGLFPAVGSGLWYP